VPDALRVQQFDGFPHRSRTHGLAGVHGGVQSGGAGPSEAGDEGGGGHQGLVATDADPQ